MATPSRYHKEDLVTVKDFKGNEIKIPRSKVARKLQEISVETGKVVSASDRVYLEKPDGSLIRMQPDRTKAERKAHKKMMRDLRRGQ